MPDVKPRFANFPERELKVVIGDHINPTNTKLLTKLTIGKYEMSFIQQENANVTLSAVKECLGALAKAEKLTLTIEDKNREFLSIVTAKNDDKSYQIWISTPFELTQSAHLLWCKVSEGGKVAVSFKILTKYTADDIANLVKAAQRNLVEVPAGEPYVLKGNPAPRFQKKVKAAEAAPAETAEAAPAEA
jgi:hypothetical protein